MVVTEIAKPFYHSFKERSACLVLKELYFVFIMKHILANKGKCYTSLKRISQSLFMLAGQELSVIFTNMSIL